MQREEALFLLQAGQGLRANSLERNTNDLTLGICSKEFTLRLRLHECLLLTLISFLLKQGVQPTGANPILSYSLDADLNRMGDDTAPQRYTAYPRVRKTRRIVVRLRNDTITY